MSEQTRTVLKTYFETGDKPTQAQFGDLIDSAVNNVDDKLYLTYPTIDTLTDGASITVNFEGWGQRAFFLSTAEGTPTANISNFGINGHITIEKTAVGDSTLTVQGTGYKFIDMNNKAAAAASVDLTLSDDWNEVNLQHSGTTDDGDVVINVTKL